jgi:hypothetical protein
MNRIKKYFYKIHKIIWVVINLGFVHVTAMDRRVFGQVKRSKARLWTTDGECVAPATNCGLRELRGLRRQTATNDGVEQCTSERGELERWGELG